MVLHQLSINPTSWQSVNVDERASAWFQRGCWLLLQFEATNSRLDLLSNCFVSLPFSWLDAAFDIHSEQALNTSLKVVKLAHWNSFRMPSVAIARIEM